VHTKKVGIYLSMVLTMFFWGLTFVFYKVAFESFRPMSVILLRLVISVIFIFIAGRLLKKIQKVKRKDLRYFFGLAFFEPFLYFLGESNGITYVSPTLAAVIVSTIPLIVPVAAFFIYRERLSRLNTIGLLLSFIGVIVVVFASEVEWAATIKGVLLMFLAVFSAVGYALLVKKMTHQYNGFTITVWQNFFGSFLFLPIVLWLDLDTLVSTIPSPNAILAMLYLAIFGSSITFILFTRGVRELGTSKANIFANLIPVFTAIFSFLILGEEMPVLKIGGIIIVLIGLVLSQSGPVSYKKSKLPPTYQYPV
jgi:drug/metabolite transporter (DMT)-like permease